MNIAGHEDESITEINIAPLVDVILVLLIIFMATAPLIQRRTLNINVPKAAYSEPKATQTLNLIINEKHEILIEKNMIPLHELSFQLSTMLRADPALHIAVLADQMISYGEVVEVLDVIRGAGIKKVALEVRGKKKE